MYTLVPLGNPGSRYENTRHNVARVLLSLIMDEVMKLPSFEIMTPKTYMNESGRAVTEYLRYHEGRELIIMYDDKDLPYGTLRISYGRGDGGHNGLKSVIEALGKKEFIRLRVGIAGKNEDGSTRSPKGEAVQGYVLGAITDDEKVLLRAIASRTLSLLQTIVEHGYIKAMEVYNGM
jgi:PTH1 family peptidyl-tRNA hydrolase